MKPLFLKAAIALLLTISPISAETVLVGTFFNGNNGFLNSRAYLWNPSDAAADIVARAYTLPRAGPSTLLGTVSLGQLNARSGRNIKIAEDILVALGILLPYVADGGNLMVEFTVGADNVRGTGQVFTSDLAFGTYPLEVMPSSTIPATVLRPDPPTTGLNTSLTDPDGQWTATASAKIIEKNDTYWEFSYFVDMTNRTDEEQEYTVTVHFVDADGFSVEDGYAGDVFNKIPAKSTKRLLDRALIDTENAPTVVGILLEVNVR